MNCNKNKREAHGKEKLKDDIVKKKLQLQKSSKTKLIAIKIMRTKYD